MESKWSEKRISITNTCADYKLGDSYPDFCHVKLEQLQSEKRITNRFDGKTGMNIIECLQTLDLGMLDTLQ